MSKKVSDLVAATVLNDTDDFLITQGGESKKLAASLVGGAPGPFGSLAFEWNGTDVSQFEGVSAFFDSISGSAGSLSVVASAEFGNVLRYSSAGGSQVREVILANDPLPFTGESRDYTIEIETLVTTGGGSVSYGGVAIMCDDSAANFHGAIHAGSVNSNRSQCLINNGTVETASAFGSAANRFSRYTIRGAKPAAAAPHFESRIEGFGTSSHIDGGLRRSGSSPAARGNVNPFGDGSSVLGSTWDPLDCDRWGLGIVTLSGGPPNTTWDIKALRVFVK